MGIRERILEVMDEPYPSYEAWEQLIDSEATARSKADRLALLETLRIGGEHLLPSRGYHCDDSCHCRGWNDATDMLQRKLDAAQKEINKE